MGWSERSRKVEREGEGGREKERETERDREREFINCFCLPQAAPVSQRPSLTRVDLGKWCLACNR